MQVLIEEIWQIRLRILRGEDYECPLALVPFFTKYAKAVTPANGRIPQLSRRYKQYLLPSMSFGTVLACSPNGADSTLMKYLMPTFPILQIADSEWREVPKYHKREFQIGLHAMSRYFTCVYVGISDFDEAPSAVEASDPYQFEYSTAFLDLWNRFMPVKMFYPLYYLSKVDIYRRLLQFGHDLTTLNPCNRGHAYCADCLKCLAHYLLVRTLSPNSKLQRPTVQIVERARAEWDSPADFHDVKKCVRQLGLGTDHDFPIP